MGGHQAPDKARQMPLAGSHEQSVYCDCRASLAFGLSDVGVNEEAVNLNQNTFPR